MKYYSRMGPEAIIPTDMQNSTERCSDLYTIDRNDLTVKSKRPQATICDHPEDRWGVKIMQNCDLEIILTKRKDMTEISVLYEIPEWVVSPREKKAAILTYFKLIYSLPVFVLMFRKHLNKPGYSL